MNANMEFDQLVGRVAGAIYSDIASIFPEPPLMLVPPITFKVRKMLEPVTDVRLMTDAQKSILAKELQISIIPLLFSMDIEADAIEKMTPCIESAAYKALTHIRYE